MCEGISMSNSPKLQSLIIGLDSMKSQLFSILLFLRIQQDLFTKAIAEDNYCVLIKLYYLQRKNIVPTPWVNTKHFICCSHKRPICRVFALYTTRSSRAMERVSELSEHAVRVSKVYQIKLMSFFVEWEKETPSLNRLDSGSIKVIQNGCQSTLRLLCFWARKMAKAMLNSATWHETGKAKQD